MRKILVAVTVTLSIGAAATAVPLPLTSLSILRAQPSPATGKLRSSSLIHAGTWLMFETTAKGRNSHGRSHADWQRYSSPCTSAN